MKSLGFDRPFLIISGILVLGGFFIFLSASLGVLARGEVGVGALATKQILGLLIGIVLAYFASRIPYQFWNKYSLYIFILSIIATLAVFIPGLGFSSGGATRWIDLGVFTLQPAELLKLGFVVYFSAWLAGLRGKVRDIRYGILPLILLLLVTGGVLVLQPDLGTFVVIAVTGVVLFVAAGGLWRHIFSFAIVSGGLLTLLGVFIPYVRTRLLTFLNPAADPLGAGYQIQQSLIAVGSGKFFGRGFGQSVQKFNFLPEPVSDSIFAVFAEEWGFVGAVVLLVLFLLFAIRGLKIASMAPSMFSGLLVTGIVSMIIVQSLMNIAVMLGLFPFTGMPLIFVSQGGTALMIALAEVGVILGISRTKRAV